jgi:hypothetical protein
VVLEKVVITAAELAPATGSDRKHQPGLGGDLSRNIW